MIFRIAWRNIWRNRRRSLIVMISVAIGIIAALLMDTLSRGMMVQMLENQIGSHVSHIQIHRKGFRADPVIQNFLPDPQRVQTAVSRLGEIGFWTERVITYGLLSSAESSSGITLVGIDPTREADVTTIKNSVVAGRYLSGERNEIVIGRKLAEKLNVTMGDKVVDMATSIDGSVASDVFRVVGLYETFSSEFDKVFAYVDLAHMQDMLGLRSNVSEVALLVRDRDQLDRVKEELRHELGESYEVLSYPEILPFLVLQLDIFEESMYIFYLIIGIALIFGIINTMLMSVFERITEFGVLKAIGMRGRLLVTMVVLEALLLGVLGTVAGFIIGYGIYLPLSQSGIDLSMFAESLKSIGSGSVIYPVLTFSGAINALVIIPLVAVLGAIYPAAKAARLQPIEAIRHV